MQKKRNCKKNQTKIKNKFLNFFEKVEKAKKLKEKTLLIRNLVSFFSFKKPYYKRSPHFVIFGCTE